MRGDAGRKHARRFVKFCIVGASSTLIQLTTLQIALRVLHTRSDAAVLWANAAGVVLAILNGFYWNRRWTFRRHRQPGAGGEFVKFALVSAVGLALNTALMYLFYVRLRLFRPHEHAPLLCQMLTIALVVFWNFTANTKWSFGDDPASSV
jgi:putative flippase GtrA